MTEGLTGWETTRLSKHFILLDFMADRDVYRPVGGSRPLPFENIWNGKHEALAKGVCDHLLKPLTMNERFGPISIADAFVPSVLKTRQEVIGHRWAEGGGDRGYRALQTGGRRRGT